MNISQKSIPKFEPVVPRLLNLFSEEMRMHHSEDYRPKVYEFRAAFNRPKPRPKQETVSISPRPKVCFALSLCIAAMLPLMFVLTKYVVGSWNYSGVEIEIVSKILNMDQIERKNDQLFGRIIDRQWVKLTSDQRVELIARLEKLLHHHGIKRLNFTDMWDYPAVQSICNGSLCTNTVSPNDDLVFGDVSSGFDIGNEDLQKF